MNPFDAVTCPLQESVFIEASAGTGKTYSITSLVLRLLLEKGLATNQILLVTYTNAATDELRRKMRERVMRALDQLSGAALTERDHLVDELVRLGRVNPVKAIETMRTALLSFEELPILTIHGFCQRVLAEHAFETGNLFDTEILPDESNIVKELVLDFWRGMVADQSFSFFAYIEAKKKGLVPLERIAQNASDRTDVALIPRPQRWSVEVYETAFKETLKEARDILRNDRETIEKVLGDSEVNKRSYNSAHLPNWLNKIDQWLDSDIPMVSVICSELERFTNEKLGESAQEGAPPSHEFFDICDRLSEVGRQHEEQLEILWTQMKRELIEFLWRALPEKKEELNCYAYNDLLAKTYRALIEEKTELASLLGERYGAILIDEFQDTDPTQYAIFRSIHETKTSSLLCLIGDPKQAIYGFRGGDIHTYTHARSEAAYKATLLENWRSDPGLIQALNTLFTLPPNPFMSPEIQYHEVKAPDHRIDSSLVEGAESDTPPLQIWQIAIENQKLKLQDACAQAVAGEIARLLRLADEGEFSIGGRPLVPSDIAIIIRSHYQVEGVQKALRSQGIGSVSYERQHVFHTRQAEDLAVLLRALVLPRDENSLKTFLLSDLVGMTTEALAELLEDDLGWSGVLERFAIYRARWQSHGFIGMFRELLRNEAIAKNLLRFPDGERRMTNILHLSELVEEAQASLKLTPRGTLKWFHEQTDTKQSEERELRLESDDDRVKILTIHRSKGLEFPIVFFPFGWVKPFAGGSKEMVIYHQQKEGTWNRIIDLGSKAFDEHQEDAREEAKAEEMRMTYVALTRAKQRLYVMLAMDSGYKKSSLAYLLHHKEMDKERCLADFEKLVDTRKPRADMQRFMANSGGTLLLKNWDGVKESVVPLSPSERGSTVRQFSGAINRQWRIASYSSLVGQREALDRPDYDALTGRVSEESDDENPSGMFALAKGARTGNMLHQLYQKLSFQADQDVVEKLVEEQLKSYGFDVDEWKSVLLEHLIDLLILDLNGFSLHEVADSKRMNELEFHFPIAQLTARKLNTYFDGQSLRAADHASYFFRPVEGYLKGYIDMVFEHNGVFYLVDYKSNYLGGTYDHYQKERLVVPMKESDYILQYHLYTVALHRFLKYRLGTRYRYDQHFGGVYYLFLRGISASRGSDVGVYFDKPTYETVERLDSLLTGKEGSVSYG